MRKIYDAPVYSMTPGATANSATKLAHDICGYLWYPFVICTMGAPVVVYAIATGNLPCVIASVIAVVSLGCWFGLDALFDAKRKGWDLCAMHPDDTNTWYRQLLNKWQLRCNELRGGTAAGQRFVTLEIVKDCYDQTYLLDRDNDKSYQLVREGRAYTAIPSTYSKH